MYLSVFSNIIISTNRPKKKKKKKKKNRAENVQNGIVI